jgi:diguanylate cyclase (GGDEF)-like protein/PAS domain S-box-containing protein
VDMFDSISFVGRDGQLLAAAAGCCSLLFFAALHTHRRWRRRGLFLRDRGQVTDRELRRHVLRLEAALHDMAQGVCLFDKEQRLIVCNARYAEIFGLPLALMTPGTTLRQIMEIRAANGAWVDGNPETFIGDRLRVAAENKPERSLLEFRDGRVIAVAHQPTLDGGWVATFEDISDRIHAEGELARTRAFLSEARAEAERSAQDALAAHAQLTVAFDELREARVFLDTVIENVPVGIVVKTSNDLRYVLVNKAAEAFYGLPRAEVIGKTAHDIYPKETADIIAADRQKTPINGRSHIEMEVLTPRNGMRFMTSESLPIVGGNGAVLYWLTVIDDVTDRKRAERRLAHLAHHDPLTDLPNRAAFKEMLDTALAQSAATGNGFALLSCDLDYFKQINDVFGHAVGDELLCEASRRLSAVAEGAFLSRIGGDEFMLISSEGDQPATATLLAQRLLKAISENFKILGHEVHIGLSIGVAVYPADGADAVALLANADAALYRAKADGRFGARFFEPYADKQVRERHSLQHDLLAAVARSEFVLHYQPQAAIGGEVLGFEALIRWWHPQHGLVPPGAFIPLAEDNGQIVQIGEWVIRQACREAASWASPLQVSVNISPIQFRHGDLPSLVHSILLETGLAPGRLEVEITEGVMISDLPRALSILRRLKSLGVKIVMDDFGTGYSSLFSLKSFPFDKLKIDRTFIAGVNENGQSATIVRAIIGLGHGLGISVTAEGVESEEQQAFLSSEACDEIQGYLIGRPRPISEYAAVMNGGLLTALASVAGG